MLTISRRAQNTPASAIRKLAPFAEQAKSRGVSIYHLNIGQPDLPTPQPILDFIHHFKEKTLEYAPSLGLKEAVEAWQNFYSDKEVYFEKEEILVTSGGSEALLFAFLSVCDPGEELLIFEPFYTSYASLAAMGNIVIKPVTTVAKTGYHLPSQQMIEKAIVPKTKAIVFNNPNNPTGAVFTEEEVRMIKDIALKHNLFIISDDTYQEIVFDDKKLFPLTVFPELNEQLIIADSVSKRFNSCGARVGCLATHNKDILNASLRFGQGRLSVATVEQLALVPVLKNHLFYVSTLKEIYQSRRDAVVRELKKIPGIKFLAPQGAFYIMVTLPLKDSDDFARFLLSDFSDKNETVMVAPGTGFYATPGLGCDEIRLAYVLNEVKLQRAVELLGMGLKKYLKSH